MKNNAYCQAIDFFIPQAEKIARKKVRLTGKSFQKREGADDRYGDPSTYRHCYFTEYFHEAMNKLCREAGLRL